MEKKYLIINLGSTSKRYSLYLQGKSVLDLSLQKKGSGYSASAKHHDVAEEIEVPKSEFSNSVKFVKDSLLEFGIIEDIKEISAIGIRIVAPGNYFLKNKVIDANYVKELESAEENAPLHIAPVLSELKQIKKILSGIKVVGVSDSSFHHPLPEKTKVYAIPKSDAKKYGVYRQGYHGLSVASSVRYLRSSGLLKKKTIVCHLGGGCSIVALNNGRSVDTSMGFTPVEGVFGSTRSGDIDAGAMIHLGKKLKLSLSGLESYLNNKSGLSSLAGNGDMRIVLEKAKKGNVDSKQAIESFVYKVRKYIGAYAVALGGLDCIVFTGAMGVGSQYIRSKICEDLGCLGVSIDPSKNRKTDDKEGFVQSGKSKVKVILIKPREMQEIYLSMKNILS